MIELIIMLEDCLTLECGTGCVSVEICIFRSVGMTAVHRAGNCGRKGTANDCNPDSLMQYVRKS